MTVQEANATVERALKDAEEAALFYASAYREREATLDALRAAREVLEDLLREAAGLKPRTDRREEYLRLYTGKA